MNSYRIEFRRILLSCARNFDANLAAVLASDDAQGPHHARVALRRMRSALGAFARIIDKEAGAEVETRAKRFFRLLGRVRDADVLLLDFATPSDREALAAEAAEIRADVRATLRLRGALAFSPALLKRLEDGSFFRTGSSARLRREGPVEDCATRALLPVRKKLPSSSRFSSAGEKASAPRSRKVAR
ncbi:MAG: CHAD domain-containing protein, partial [Rhodobacteraceae bacterium]|nr:CHAD domain-containing protein [Paracoccaceae bacterium]